ncbi:MAG: hypothetical protein ABSG46_20255 [Candidatus Binataceae bacterium]|jgi:hypothetical protein
MATQTLTAQLCGADSVANNVTTGLTVITGGNTVAFPNFPGQTILLISVGGTGGTVQTTVGSTIFGQAFASYTALTLTLSTIYVLGPFHSALELPGASNVVQVITSAGLVASMACLQLSGVY